MNKQLFLTIVTGLSLLGMSSSATATGSVTTTTNVSVDGTNISVPTNRNTTTVNGTNVPPTTTATPTTAPTTSAPTPDKSQKPTTPDVGAIGQSAITTRSACTANATSSNCINSAAGTLDAAGVKLAPGTTAAIGTAAKIADFNPSAQIQQLTSSCSNIANPMACVSSAQGVLGKLGGLGVPGLSEAATSLNTILTNAMGDVGKTLAGVFGQGGASAPPTNKQVEAVNSNSIQTVANQSLAAEIAAKKAAATLINAGNYTPGVSTQITTSQSQALATATLGAPNLQAMQTNTVLAAQDVDAANTVAGTTYDNSLDALNAGNQTMAGIVRGQERINSAMVNNTLLQGQALKQSVATYQAIDATNQQKITQEDALLARKNLAICYIASITNRNACK
jgi:hypothetical protein